MIEKEKNEFVDPAFVDDEKLRLAPLRNMDR